MIKLKRAYDRPEPSDGTRFLVDQLWPRGIKKEALQAEAWFKEVAPSSPLRKWFGHDPRKWEQFQERYFAELNGKPETWQRLAQAASKGPITLLFSARDTEHNNAVALKAYLEKHRTKRAARRKRLVAA
jgi:uncharacterized protein YeaO (DUF488 family)